MTRILNPKHYFTRRYWRSLVTACGDIKRAIERGESQAEAKRQAISDHARRLHQ